LRLQLLGLFRRHRVPKGRADQRLSVRKTDQSDGRNSPLESWQHASPTRGSTNFQVCRCYGCTGRGGHSRAGLYREVLTNPARSAGALNSFHESVTLLFGSVLRPLALIWANWRRANMINAVTAPGLAAGRNSGRRLNRFVLCGSNHAGGRLLDDDCGFDRRFDRHLRGWSSFHCLRRPLFLGRRFLRVHARALDLGFRFFRCRVLCSHLARRLSACLAAFRTFLTRRNALLCFCHGYLLEIMLPARQRYVALCRNDSPLGRDNPTADPP